MTSALFTPYKLRKLELANRIVVSPMCQYSAIDGCATDWHLLHWGQLLQSSAGMFTIEATAVSAIGQAKDNVVAGLAGSVKVVGAVGVAPP